MSSLNLAEIQQTLNRLMANIAEGDRKAYDVYYNPVPQDVVMQRYDAAGNLINVTIPNNAKLVASANAAVATKAGGDLYTNGGNWISDFHTNLLSDPPVDYDFRWLVYPGGGDGVVGTAECRFAGGSFTMDVDIARPGSDGACSLGYPTERWGEIYAASGTINTSDAREKQQIGGLPDEWLDAWASVEFQRFQFNDAVASKGSAARWHCGVIAQRIEAAFKAHGLDAFELGLLCYDEWEAKEAVNVEKDGQVLEVIPARPAGSRYGVRYEEALCLEAAYQRREMARQAAKVAELEAKLARLEQAAA